MSTWFQPISIASGDAAELLSMVAPNAYCVVDPASIPSLSVSLLAKCDSVLVMRSGSHNEEYVVANLYRRDNGAIDQMPFGTAFVSGYAASGLLTHHGDWDYRTVPGAIAPPHYHTLSNPSSSAYQQAFATLAMPSQQTGSIYDLTPKSNVDAFDRVVAELKRLPANY